MNNIPSKKVTRVTAAILTVAFLGFVFAAFFAMVVGNRDELVHSIQMTPAMKKALPKNAGPLDRLSARINGFTSTISEIMWHKEEMGYVNSAFQYGLGKRVINTGSQNMITLADGHLYDLADYRDLSQNAREIAALRRTTLGDIPFLFTYEHPTLYDASLMPAGYEALDHSAQMADEAIATLKAEGVDVLDSRDVLPHCGRDMNDLLMVTDQHWSTLAAITMAQAIAARLNEMTGAALDTSLLDLENLNTLVHEKLFMGKYGQRVGPGIVDPDDIVEYWPKYDTHVTRNTRRSKTVENEQGDWRTVMTRFDRLAPDPGKTWNKTAYTYYGQVERYDIMTNEAAPDYTVLLLKDSYSAPIGRFLSLLARHVICVDLRQDVDPLETWVEQYHPDAVVMAYSLQMLRDDAYAFE
ncbi:MAG: hypothetical protein IJI26_00500 [Clostridia bacterium]|nr:hypothetical protein [Clostridia bacterium]